MTYDICTVLCGGDGPQLGQDFRYVDNRDNKLSPCEAYQNLLEHTTADVLMYSHDDVIVNDLDWVGRVMEVFDKPNVVAVGFGGATALGHPNLYKKPYNIWNMAREGYVSNQTDAEVHGERFSGVLRVATLDAFFMAVGVSWLRSLGGWPIGRLTHHCLDLWLACEVARANKEIWMVGVDCTHLGGRSSTKGSYSDAKWLQGGTVESDHAIPHRWLHENYRDVLPIRV